MSDKPVLRFRYRNYKGEISDRRVGTVIPDGTLTLMFGPTPQHPVPGWNLRGWDLDRGALRTFRLTDILAWLDDDGNPINMPDAALAAENAELRWRLADLEK